MLTLCVCFVCAFTGGAFQLNSASSRSVQLVQGRQVPNDVALELIALLFIVSYLECQKSIQLLPARASEQGNVIGSVRIYIYICVCTN